MSNITVAARTVHWCGHPPTEALWGLPCVHKERLGDGGEGVELDPVHYNEESLSHPGKDSIRRPEEYG